MFGQDQPEKGIISLDSGGMGMASGRFLPCDGTTDRQMGQKAARGHSVPGDSSFHRLMVQVRVWFGLSGGPESKHRSGLSHSGQRVNDQHLNLEFLI